MILWEEYHVGIVCFGVWEVGGISGQRGVMIIEILWVGVP